MLGTYYPAPGCWIEESFLVLYVKVWQTVDFKWRSEKLLLWFDDIFIHTEESANPLKWWVTGFQVIGLQGQFDVHNFSEAAQQFPRCVHFYKYKLFIPNLQWMDIHR